MPPLPIPRLEPVEARDRYHDRLTRLETLQEQGLLAQEVTGGRLTLLISEVAKLKAALAWRASIGSAIGTAAVALAAKVFGG